jgi:hypothetical protein
VRGSAPVAGGVDGGSAGGSRRGSGAALVVGGEESHRLNRRPRLPPPAGGGRRGSGAALVVSVGERSGATLVAVLSRLRIRETHK